MCVCVAHVFVCVCLRNVFLIFVRVYFGSTSCGLSYGTQFDRLVPQHTHTRIHTLDCLPSSSFTMSRVSGSSAVASAMANPGWLVRRNKSAGWSAASSRLAGPPQQVRWLVRGIKPKLRRTWLFPARPRYVVPMCAALRASCSEAQCTTTSL